MGKPFGISIQGKLRPCYIIANNTKTKALFHCWGSLGDMGCNNIAAVVETIDGNVILVHPQSIKFSDNACSEYYWGD